LAVEAAEDASEGAKEAMGRRQANVAIALLKLGAAEHVWRLFKHSPDPRARSNLVHWLGPQGADLQSLVERLDNETDVSTRRALLLALGEFPETQLGVSARQSLIPRLRALYEAEPDAGLRAAAGWLLRIWNQDKLLNEVTKKLVQSGRPADTNAKRIGPPGPVAGPARGLTGGIAQWYVNGQGQTFVILEAGEFLMGSPFSEPDCRSDEVQHRRRIGRTFAIAATAVTKEQYRRFLEANRDVQRRNIDEYSRSDDSPQIAVDWCDAARYCNWLSAVEGIPESEWCYQPRKHGIIRWLTTDRFGEMITPAPGFLERTGYRLPTEAEWEFACRAGAMTSRYYGANEDLLPKYAWFLKNSPGDFARPTGLLKPNDFGLFDILGNTLEWCHDTYAMYPITEPDKAANDDTQNSPGDANRNRVLRGTSFLWEATNVRSARRHNYQPLTHFRDSGFRPARTYR
jgi:formylglycine-generating enzyme required for sulfatase activity